MEVKINRKKLIETRYEKGLGIKELAGIAGVSQMTILSIEGGERTTTPGTLLKVCKALNLSINEVIEVVA